MPGVPATPGAASPTSQAAHGCSTLGLDSDHPDFHDVLDAYRTLLAETGRDPDVLGPRTPRTLATELRRQGLTKAEAEAEVRARIESRRDQQRPP